MVWIRTTKTLTMILKLSSSLQTKSVSYSNFSSTTKTVSPKRIKKSFTLSKERCVDQTNHYLYLNVMKDKEYEKAVDEIEALIAKLNNPNVAVVWEVISDWWCDREEEMMERVVDEES